MEETSASEEVLPKAVKAERGHEEQQGDNSEGEGGKRRRFVPIATSTLGHGARPHLALSEDLAAVAAAVRKGAVGGGTRRDVGAGSNVVVVAVHFVAIAITALRLISGARGHVTRVVFIVHRVGRVERRGSSED